MGVLVGMGRVGGTVRPDVGGIAIGAGVEGAQAVSITIRNRPAIKNHRRLCMGYFLFSKNIHHLQAERSRNYAAGAAP